MKPHKNNARVAVKAAALPQRIPAKGDKAPPKTAQPRQNLRYTAPVLKSMVHSNTVPVEVAAPTFKRGFVTSKFWGLVRLRHPFMVSGGMGLPARMAARLQACLKHPVHLLRVQTQTVAFFGSPVGNQP